MYQTPPKLSQELTSSLEENLSCHWWRREMQAEHAKKNINYNYKTSACNLNVYSAFHWKLTKSRGDGGGGWGAEEIKRRMRRAAGIMGDSKTLPITTKTSIQWVQLPNKSIRQTYRSLWKKYDLCQIRNESYKTVFFKWVYTDQPFLKKHSYSS